MKNVAFFLDNTGLPHIDYQTITNGNPGIGGSEYEFLLVSYLLSKRENDLHVHLLFNSRISVPVNQKAFVANLENACQYCIEKGIEKLVVDIKSYDRALMERYGDRLSYVVWLHNFATYSVLDELERMKCVSSIVNVGREQLELYRDHLATLKSTYIYNIIPIKGKSYYGTKMDLSNNHNVVYMGSLVKAKGFLQLAEAWKKVLYEVPDAHLYVIGSGKLYDSQSKLGPYGLADEEYESKFISFITDDSGAILPSVHFVGLMGEEKYDIMGKCKVGVPNPTGVSETFCICGLEMQLVGCNITTLYHPAYLDTIYNKSFLYPNVKSLADYIIKRLLSSRDDVDTIYDYISNKFNPEKSLSRWENLLSGKCIVLEEISDYPYQYKNVKNILLRLKLTIPFLRFIPPIGKIINLLKLIKSKI